MAMMGMAPYHTANSYSTHQQLDAAPHTAPFIGDMLSRFQSAIEKGAGDQLRALLLSHCQVGPQWHAIAPLVLRMVVQEGNADLARVYFSCSSTFGCGSSEWQAPQRPLLHIAVEQDNAEMVEALLQNGGPMDRNVRDTDHTGSTALHLAVEWDSIHVQALLVRAGADPNAQTTDGWTPLHIAAEHGHIASCEFLVRAGADLTIQATVCGSTALHIAAREGHVDVIQFLLDHGADPTSRDNDGRTVLHVASFFDESAARFARSDLDKQSAVVALLLANGVDADTRDLRGDSPLHCAQQGSFEVIVDLLLAAHRKPIS